MGSDFLGGPLLWSQGGREQYQCKLITPSLPALLGPCARSCLSLDLSLGSCGGGLVTLVLQRSELGRCAAASLRQSLPLPCLGIGGGNLQEEVRGREGRNPPLWGPLFPCTKPV